MLTILLFILRKIGITSAPAAGPHGLKSETLCFGSRSHVRVVMSTITRLVIHVAREDRTKPKHMFHARERGTYIPWFRLGFHVVNQNKV